MVLGTISIRRITESGCLLRLPVYGTLMRSLRRRQLIPIWSSSVSRVFERQCTRIWGVSQIQGNDLEDWMKEELGSIMQVQEAPEVDLSDGVPKPELQFDMSR